MHGRAARRKKKPARRAVGSDGGDGGYDMLVRSRRKSMVMRM